MKKIKLVVVFVMALLILGGVERAHCFGPGPRWGVVKVQGQRKRIRSQPSYRRLYQEQRIVSCLTAFCLDWECNFLLH